LSDVPVVTSQRTSADGASAGRDTGGTSAPLQGLAREIDRVVRDQIGSGSSLYSLDEALALALKPDVILTQDLCSVCSIDANTVRRVAERIRPTPPVVNLNPGTIEEVFEDVLTVGRAVGLEDAAAAAVVRLRERMFRALEFVNPYVDGPTIAFLEWTDPLFVGGHWTPQLIERAGGRHPLNPTVGQGSMGPSQEAARRAGPSRRVSVEELVASRPERVIVCPCGVPLWAFAAAGAAMTVESLVTELERTPWWHELPAVMRGKVALVDGNQMFNRPGPRLVDALEWLVAWLNDRPGAMPAGFPWRRQ
jgi:ABC-type Fe3+-hydroxamate transport system substrate-binding protein